MRDESIAWSGPNLDKPQIKAARKLLFGDKNEAVRSDALAKVTPAVATPEVATPEEVTPAKATAERKRGGRKGGVNGKRESTSPSKPVPA